MRRTSAAFIPLLAFAALLRAPRLARACTSKIMALVIGAFAIPLLGIAAVVR